mmetsp:Transcript_71141/g.112665  ORF Transcript_71141/g.112665 Transcript_71141/m.112665 type:complete len:860 (-) Transcript_71141:91-2670(-)
MNGEAPSRRPRAPAVRPSSVPISFCWPPAQGTSGQAKDPAPGHQASAARPKDPSGVSGGKAKERAETAPWPPRREPPSAVGAVSDRGVAPGSPSEAQLLSWKPCFEESFRVFNYIMTSDVAAAVAVAAQSAVVPLEATNRSKRRESREQRLSPWNLFSRTAPQEQIGLLAGRKLLPPRPQTPEVSQAIEAEPADAPSRSASGAACRAAQNLGRQARPSSALRRPPARQVKRSKSRERHQMGVPHQVRCRSRGRLRGVQRQRALQLLQREGEEEELQDGQVPRAPAIAGQRPPIKLLLSSFAGHPPVLLFDYHPAVGEKQMDPDRIVCCEGRGRPEIFFSHSGCVHRYNAVLNSFYYGGLEESFGAVPTLLWGGIPRPEALREFRAFQKTNHFPASWHLGRKDLLWRNIRSMQQRYPDGRFDLMPQTFLVPGHFKFWMAARELEPKAWWIWKPINSSCGRGIKLLPSHLTNKVIARLESKQGIIQRYVERPLLLDGYKFDLRLYVVVTSFDPLKVYLFKEGLVRLATERYSLNPNSLKKRTMHLTNYSVNKRSAKYVHNRDGKAPPAPKVAVPEEDLATMELEEEPEDCPTEAGLTDMNESEDEEEGDEASASGTSASDPQGQATSKWTLKDLQEYFDAKGLDYPLVLSKIKELIVKSLIAVETPVVSAWHNGANYARRSNGASLVGPNQTCFELYGFDVLVDQKLRPWLLEVNTCPSLSSSSPLDKRLKTQLVADMLTLVGLSPHCEERPSSGRSLSEKGARVHTRPTVERLQSENLRLRDLGEAEWSIILDAHDEYLRRGAYERIFPDLNFQEFFRIQRYGNCVLAKWLREGGETCFLPGREDLRPNWLPLQLFTGAC